ncbi:hypothetical protein [Streptomyces sp. NPDC046985]|uniref:hypothetical protein n=1 Tax=Streptomyces sp. NPDC046985 TaxID=3155377 RepID=UPI0033DF0E16
MKRQRSVCDIRNNAENESTQKGDIRITEATHGTVVLRTEAGALSIGAARGVRSL